MARYSLLVKNASRVEGDFCLFQTSPDSDLPGVMSLAWLVNRAHPTTSVKFDWAVDYGFMWGETGILKPGITFGPSQMWPADLTGSNQVTLTTSAGAFMFANPLHGPVEGKLNIIQDHSVRPNVASVGTSMAGAGTFVVQAAPNMSVVFTPQPNYWLTFGNYQQGQVLEIAQITNAAQVEFPPNVYIMSATLNPDYTWTIAPV